MKKSLKIIMSLGLLMTGSLSFGQATAEATGVFDKVRSFWPFVVVLTLLLLAILWYQTIKSLRRPRKSTRRQTRGLNSVATLGIVTVFVVVLLAFPWIWANSKNKELSATQTTEIAPENRVETTFLIEGMTCIGCENTITNRVAEFKGVQKIDANWQEAWVLVVYDKALLSEDLIIDAIHAAGYRVTGTLKE